MNKGRWGQKWSGAPVPFSELLRQLMRDGVRPDGTPGRLGRPWTIEQFADEIGVSHDTLRKWLSGARRPKYTINIERRLFGDSKKFECYRRQLRAAHEASRSCSSGELGTEAAETAMCDRMAKEVNLFEALKKECPDDHINRTPGGDILHIVMRNGQRCGAIIYDTRRLITHSQVAE